MKKLNAIADELCVRCEDVRDWAAAVIMLEFFFKNSAEIINAVSPI